MIRREIQPASVPHPVAEYAQGVEVQGGRTLYISGQVPMDAEGNLVGDDIRALIEEAGGQMSDIVKLTTYLTDMDDYRDFVEVRSEFIAPPYPAATLVAVSALVRPEWLLEVEAVAVIG